jgi:hypothetical protein
MLAVAVAGLLLARFPAPLWARTALVVGYLPLYEYGVLSRNCPSVPAVFVLCRACRPAVSLAAVAAALPARARWDAALPGLARVRDHRRPRNTRLRAGARRGRALLGAGACRRPTTSTPALVPHFEPWRMAYVAAASFPRCWRRAGLHFGRSALFHGRPRASVRGQGSVYVVLLAACGGRAGCAPDRASRHLAGRQPVPAPLLVHQAPESDPAERVSLSAAGGGALGRAPA